MGLIEDLKSLEELHTRGRLSDEEFATAKAAAISASNKSSNAATAAASPARAADRRILVPQKKSKTLTLVWRLVGVVLLLWLLWLFLGRPSPTAIRKMANLPVDVRSDSFGLPAASWKSVAIDVPYEGSLTISVQVARGNPVRVFLTDKAGLEAFRDHTDGSVRYFAGFYSDKTKSFDHSARISQGQYHLVVYDPSFGILSSSSSDISLKAHIDP